MKLSMLGIAGMSVLLGLCVTLGITRSTSAQAQEATLSPEARRHNAERTLDVAKLAYEKLKYVRDRNPPSISDKVLSDASLEWLKAEVALARSKPQAMKAAKEYLEREGTAVGE